ncbi:MAG: 3-hydroxyacyl-CoA dehydrogenase NAD-binding domain-containing protein [Proteobacteria bacterium]|nr:3-hydroxyacyl-CoA dehydrogenase NAD-binding domain-containing protein [Pseudomonadota bacterium]
MRPSIERATVLGAGVMGSGIAAHLAGAGIRTLLLDIVLPATQGQAAADPGARTRVADQALAKALKARPALFYEPDAARLISTGNFDDHLEQMRDSDLVVEAVVENLQLKQALFERIMPFVKDDAILASNTSGLSIAAMSDGLPASVQPRFLVMHFFNPVRYMRLLELVTGPKTEPQVLERARSFGEFLGKGIVLGKDTPNFVANRIGIYNMMQALHLMKAGGYAIEEIDRFATAAGGRGGAGPFKTCDLVGLDTIVHVSTNCYDSLAGDEERDVFKVPDWVTDLVRQGRLGRKTGAGFYKKSGKEILVLDLDSGDYRPQRKVSYPSLDKTKNLEEARPRLQALTHADDRAGRFIWDSLSRNLCYAARRVGEIADDIVSIDRAMRWGFNAQLGPFETWDALGVAESVERLRRDGRAVPSWVSDMLAQGGTSFYSGDAATRTYFDVSTKSSKPLARDPRHLSIDVLKCDSSNVIKRNMGASLIDLGDGCLCLEVHTKMNSLDSTVFEMVDSAVEEAERNFEAIVMGNDGAAFGAGANLFVLMAGIQQKQWDQIERAVRQMQTSLQKLRYASVPVVAAPFQFTLAGAAELAMAADACQAHAETYMGLVEIGVGLVPAGTGCLRMVERFTGDVRNIEGVDLLPLIGTASLNLATARVATSAAEAKSLRFLRPDDGITLNRDHLLQHAKQRALGMARSGYRPQRPPQFRAAGVDVAKTLSARVWGMVEGAWASDHDALIANKLAHILCGGDVNAGALLPEQAWLDLECEAFLSLCGEEKTLARIQHMLMHNKPLRN